MKVVYRQTASDDIVRQFRYYLLAAEVPEVAVRFREAVRRTIQSLSQNPYVGPRYSSGDPRLQNLRSWPAAGFEAIRIYDALEADAMHIIRILRGKRVDPKSSQLTDFCPEVIPLISNRLSQLSWEDDSGSHHACTRKYNHGPC